MNRFRSLVRSKFGGAIILLFLVVLAFSFVTTDLNSLGVSGKASTTTVATVGGQDVAGTELVDRVQRELDAAKQQDPTLDMARFVATGGVETVLQRITDSMVLDAFAKKEGIVVSRRLEDGQIASIPAFIGLDGKFSRANFDQFLIRSKMSEAQLRKDLSRDVIANQLILPVSGASRAPAALALPYASMLLEVRQGRAAFVPVSAVPAGPPPGDAALADYYKRNIARYTLPERRIARYALVTQAQFDALATPTEAEISRAYADAKDKYAPSDTRTLTQVIVPTEAAAKALAAKVAAGTPIAAAATAAGGEAVTLDPQTRASFAELSSPAVADAAFAAQRGAVATPARSGFGWHVVHVDAVTAVPGKSLEQARPELVAALARAKAADAASEYLAKLEDDIAGGATFDEVIAARKLQTVTTPPLLANGRNLDTPAAPVVPELAVVAKAAFGSEPDDDPVVEAVTPNVSSAIVDLDRVIPAAPRALTEIRAQVAADLERERALAETRKIASAILAKVTGGTPIAQAVASAGVRLPAPAVVEGRRSEALKRGANVPPQLTVLFSMLEHKARLVQAPNKDGWIVVYLDRVQPGDARAQPQLVEAARQQFGGVLGQEYAEQFVAAARASVGVTRNDAVVERIKKELLGAPATTDQ